MKKAMSLILAVVCITLAICPISVSAADADNDADIGVEPWTGKVFSSSADSTVYNQCELTSDGLFLRAPHSRGVGFWLTDKQYDLSQNASYTISFKMKSQRIGNVPSLYYGFGKADNLPDNTATITKTHSDSYRMRVTGNGMWDDANANSMTLAAKAMNNAAGVEAYTYGAELTYSFTVENNVLTKVSVTDGTVTCEKAYNLQIPEEYRNVFGFSVDVGYSGSYSENTFIGLISELSVMAGNEQKYYVDFAEKYRTLNPKVVYADDDGVKRWTCSGFESTSKPHPSNELTENGIEMVAPHNRKVGFWLLNNDEIFDITDYNGQNYKISLDMTTVITESSNDKQFSIQFGFKQDPSAFTGDYNSQTAINVKETAMDAIVLGNTNGNYIQLFGVKYRPTDCGISGATTSDAVTPLWNAIVSGSSPVTYSVTVKKGVVKSVTLSTTLTTGEHYFITHDCSAKNYDATAGEFGVLLSKSYKSSASNCKATVKNIKVTSSGKTVYSVDFSERYDDFKKCRATVMGGQTNDNDATLMRVVSEISLTENELNNFGSHGFKIALKGSTKGPQILESDVVYTSIQAAGSPISASDGYLGAMIVTGLTPNTEYTFVVRAFVADSDGNRYFSEAKEITIPANS